MRLDNSTCSIVWCVAFLGFSCSGCNGSESRISDDAASSDLPVELEDSYEQDADIYQSPDNYEELCERSICCFAVNFEPSAVAFTPYQVEWSASSSFPLPEGLAPQRSWLVVRAVWRDAYADFGSCDESPCGGHCVPSRGKVYVVDVEKDAVRYLGDEDVDSWKKWGPPVLPTAEKEGYRLQVDANRSYVFRRTASEWTCSGPECVPPWAACAVDLGDKGCLHFPLEASCGECPKTSPAYLRDNGHCELF